MPWDVPNWLDIVIIVMIIALIAFIVSYFVAGLLAFRGLVLTIAAFALVGVVGYAIVQSLDNDVRIASSNTNNDTVTCRVNVLGQTAELTVQRDVCEDNGGDVVRVDAAPIEPTATEVPPAPTSTEVPKVTPDMAEPAPQTPTIHDNGYETFAYEPGGESFGKWATDVSAPDGRDDCGRVWQATNLVNTTWTAVFCGWKASEGVQLQWVHPMQMNVSGNGTVEFDLYRDLGAVEQLQSGEWDWDGRDPYDVSLGEGQIGLGWYVSGSPGTACVNNKCVELGTGAYQLDFPRDWTGHHHVVLTVNDGMLTFYEGPKRTIENTWDAN